MCTGGENSLILIKLYIYVHVFYMVRLPSKKKIPTYRPIYFPGMLPETFSLFLALSQIFLVQILGLIIRYNAKLPNLFIIWLEAGNFGFRKKRNCTIRVAKTKTLISFAVTAKLICAFVCAYADCWVFSCGDSFAEGHNDI